MEHLEVVACSSSEVSSSSSSEIATFGLSEISSFELLEVIAFASSKIVVLVFSEVVALVFFEVLSHGSSEVVAFASPEVVACEGFTYFASSAAFSSCSPSVLLGLITCEELISTFVCILVVPSVCVVTIAYLHFVFLPFFLLVWLYSLAIDEARKKKASSEKY